MRLFATPDNGAEVNAMLPELADQTARYSYAVRVALGAETNGYSPDRLAALRSTEAHLATVATENALAADSEISLLRREYGAAIGLILLPPFLRHIHLATIVHNRVLQARSDFQSGADNTAALQTKDRYLLLAAGINVSDI